MSKGPGSVQRKIDAIFKENPDSSFTVEELCRRVYADWLEGHDWIPGAMPGTRLKTQREIQKRHRVAVLRAAEAVTERHPDIVTERGERTGRTLIFFNHRSVTSYATMRLKADRFAARSWKPLSDAEALRKLHENEHAKLIAPGGHWWRHVQEWIAERDNNAELKEKLKPFQEAAERESAESLAKLKQLLG